MAHLKTLGIKLIINIIVVFSIFGIFNNSSLNNLFWISLVVTLAAYLIGDLFILPRFGNLAATIADFPLAFLALWLLANMWISAPLPIVLASLFAAFFITFTEPFLHMYIKNQTEDKEETPRRVASHQLQTEFAEETDAQDIKRRDK
ncbi:YndM family protein [Ornithinibacillus halophilus]|uniref:DUF2512 family protein n=1 Tax=Ornithinibacillus halophilus TaxID=930117 RepID=A0A1M5J599_9BACI|nr:YndM family protein [Ornithinibacillus halophilus]SHG35767.1 Protein of unknown function [Ornithinibacillus halophilus]